MTEKSKPHDYYQSKVNWLIDKGYRELSALDYYRLMFPAGSFQLTNESNDDFKPNGLLQFSNKGASHSGMLHGIIYDDLDTIKQCIERKERYANHEFVTISGCSYIGKNKTNNNTRYCHALIFDIDQVNSPQLSYLLGMAEAELIPFPTAVVVSGNGVHIVYMLNEAIRLYPAKMEMLKNLKSTLTRKLWNAHTSLDPNPQYQGITQGYRAVGTLTKKGHLTRAFLTGSKVYIEELINAIDEIDVVPFLRPNRPIANGRTDHSIYSERIKKCLKDKKLTEKMYQELVYDYSHLSLNEAKELYPDWYQRRIIEKQPKGHIKYNSAVYDKWLEKIQSGAKEGNRRRCLLCLAACAQKCDIPEEKFVNDVYGLVPLFDSRTIDDNNHFTDENVKTIISQYRANDYTRMKFSTFEKMTGISYPIKNKTTTGRPVGRPSCEAVIREYITAHPEVKNKSKIARECDCTRQTVLKYFKNEVE